jgi:hypothetical protein
MLLRDAEFVHDPREVLVVGGAPPAPAPPPPSPPSPPPPRLFPADFTCPFNCTDQVGGDLHTF